MAPILIDIVLIAILVLFVFFGMRRGLISSLTGLVSLILAFFGAMFLANTLSPAASEWIAPQLETAIVDRFEETALGSDFSLTSPSPDDQSGAGRSEEDLDSARDVSLTENQLIAVLKQIGLYDSVANYVAETASQQVSQVGTAFSSALAAVLANLIAFWGIFILGFILLRIVLAVLVHALNLVAKLPVLNMGNRIGGGVFGLVQGIFVLILLVLILQFSGQIISQDTVEQTTFLRWLLNISPVSFLT